jgi:hypothetical protein
MTLGFAFFCHIMRSMDLIDRIVFLLVLTYCSSMNFFFLSFARRVCSLGFCCWVSTWYSQAGGNGVGAGVFFFFFCR